MSSKHNADDWLNDWGDDGGGGGGGGGWGDDDDLGFDDDMETGPNPYAPSPSTYGNGNGTSSGYGNGSGRMVAGGATASSSPSSYGRDSSFGASSSGGGSHVHHVGRSPSGGYGPVSSGGGGGGGFGSDGFGGDDSPYSDGSDRRRTFLLIGALLLFAIIFATLSGGGDARGWNDDDAAAADWNPDALSGGDNEAPADDADGNDDDAIQGDEIHGKGVKIMTDARTYAPGRPVSITFEDHDPKPNDWVGLYPWGSAYYDGDTKTERLPHPSIDWMYLCGSKECDGSSTAGVEDGSVVFDNVAVGRWKVYIIRNGSGESGYEFVAESEEFEVMGAGEGDGVDGADVADADGSDTATEPTYAPTKEETADAVVGEEDDDSVEDDQGSNVGDDVTPAAATPAPTAVPVGNEGEGDDNDDTSAVASLAIPATAYEAGANVIITITNPTPDELNWIGIGLQDVAIDNAEGKMVMPDDDSYLDCCWAYGALLRHCDAFFRVFLYARYSIVVVA